MNRNVASVKKSNMFAFSAILVFSMIATASSINWVSGNGIIPPPINHIYILSNGTVTPSTAPILQKGDIYALTENLLDCCIVIERDNIVLDGREHVIQWHASDIGWYHYFGITISTKINITIKNMNIKHFLYGVNLDHSSNNTIIENRMKTFKGVALEDANHNKIIGNIVTEGYGISGTGSNNLIISNHFSTTSTGMGINLWDSYNNTISHNTITHQLSISLARSQYNTISNNTMIGGRDGILLGVSSNNLIFGNIIEGKTGSRSSEGLYISYDSFGNTVFSNNFESNDLAVSLGRSPIGDTVYNNVYNNTFHHNNFVNNLQDVYVAPGAPVNFWDDGEEGNYWSDYNGNDANGDGIGDIPYSINVSNIDNHPLMKPAYLRSTDPTPLNISMISPKETIYARSDVALTVAVDKPAFWLAYSLDGRSYVTISGNITLIGLSEGTHSLTFFGSYSGREESSSVTFAVDTTAPLVSLLHPKEESYLSNEALLDLALNFTVNEPVARLTYCLDGQGNVTVEGNATLTGLATGIHNVTIYAWDKVGNIGVSETILFTITEPQPELPSFLNLTVAIVYIALAAFVSSGLLFYFKKHRRDEIT